MALGFSVLLHVLGVYKEGQRPTEKKLFTFDGEKNQQFVEGDRLQGSRSFPKQ